MDAETLTCLEFGEIRARLSGLATTPMGARLALATAPLSEAEAVEREQEGSLEAVRHLALRGGLPFGTVADTEAVLEHLRLDGSECAPVQVLETLGAMKSAREVKAFLAAQRDAYPRLWSVAAALPDLGNLIRYLDGKIGPRGEILDHASEELHAIRGDIRRAGARLEALLESLVARPEIARALMDDFVSLRSERHVVPIRAEARHQVAGIVHGVSGTGATVFVEPLETVDLNNEIVTLREREAGEVRRLLREYSELLRGRLPELRHLQEGLARLDLVMARGRLAGEMGATAAASDPAGGVRLRGARHPVLETTLRREGAAIVPLDLDLEAGPGVLVLSGPNTGGKTVALKTVGLLVLMHQSGLLVPAREAALPIVRSLFIAIGDRQSIQDGLSTFSARIRAIAGFAQHLVLPALVLLDEVGTGTDPEEGVALGIATIDYFSQKGARVVATTHLEALKAYAATTPGCANAAMQFDEGTGRPTYRLVQGVPGRSSALEIAARLGLPDVILEEARRRRGSGARLLGDSLERLERLGSSLEARLAESERERLALREERAAFESSLAAREAEMRERVTSRVEAAVEAARATGREYLESLQDRDLALRLKREEERQASHLKAEARRLISSVTRREPPEEEVASLRPGSTVEVAGLGVEATVQEVHGDRVALLVRGKRVLVPRRDCRPTRTAPARSRPALPAGVTLKRRTEGSADLVDVRGLGVDEAIETVERFLDGASLEGLETVRLVHGVGTGRLRKALREILERHPLVAAWRAAAPDEGGEGATFVSLRG